MNGATAEPATVLSLHRAGTLVARYPEVAGLLAAVSDTDLVTAGHLLGRLDPDAVAAAHPGIGQVRVAVVGHGTLAQLVAPLTAELARHGLLGRIRVADLDGWVHELGDPDSALYRSDPDLVLCVLDPMTIFDEVGTPWGVEDVERVLAAKVDLVTELAGRFRRAARGRLVVNTIPLPHRFAAQLLDLRARARLGALWRHAGARLLELSAADPAVTVVDLEPLVGEGIPVVDARLSIYASAHLSAPLLARYAREVGHLARQVTGRTRKVLATDLDDTLWGGTLGEDGQNGIELGRDGRGAAFRAFQGVLTQLRAQGVLLAAVSKNDVEPVAATLRTHPEMVVREEDFVRVVANWRPKPDNLAELAADLNLGTDSIVFVDDSPYECGLVRHARPEIAVVALGRDPAEHLGALLRDGWFDAAELTGDDRARTARYRHELARKDFLDSFSSLEDYLDGLGVTVHVARAAPADVARVAQLTLRTNQFNMTTRRLQPADVEAVCRDLDGYALTVRTADRFRENGLVGAVLAHRSDDVLHLDNLVLSCRVFGRGIEQACLAAVLGHATRVGVTEVLAEYRRTQKNAAVADFYPRHGFAVLSRDDAHATFRHDLSDPPVAPSHVQLTESIGDQSW